MTRRSRQAFPIVAVLALTGFSAQAQDGARQKFAQAQKENAERLRQYGWTSRTELKLKGETKSTRVESVRYGKWPASKEPD